MQQTSEHFWLAPCIFSTKIQNSILLKPLFQNIPNHCMISMISSMTQKIACLEPFSVQEAILFHKTHQQINDTIFNEWIQLFIESVREVGCSNIEVKQYQNYLNNLKSFLFDKHTKKISTMKQVSSLINTIKDDPEYTSILTLLTSVEEHLHE